MLTAPPRPAKHTHTHAHTGKIFLVWDLKVWGPVPWGSSLPTLWTGRLELGCCWLLSWAQA